MLKISKDFFCYLIEVFIRGHLVICHLVKIDFQLVKIIHYNNKYLYLLL